MRAEPAPSVTDPNALFAGYLDWQRDRAIEKVTSLSEAERTHTRLPSGWTPLELLHHLAYMEQRWFIWGFLGEDVPAPFGDAADGRWQVPDGTGLAEIAAMLRATGERVDRVLATHPLDAPAPPGPRFTDGPTTLSWICCHVLQEYARHLGHLDVVVELADGELGE